MMPTNTVNCQVSESRRTHPYNAFKSHTTGANHDTEVVMLDVIRSAHPNLHITPVSEKECDFIRWAAAGHAALTLKRQDNRFVSRRKYHAPESRVRGDVGSLGEHVTFGEFDLEFKGTTFRLYLAEWVHNVVGHRTRMFYILSPDTRLNEAEYCTTVDNLLLIIGKWTSELHDEVYVFDRGEWEKEASLWKAIKSSRWDDLILEPATKQSLIDDVQGFFNSRATYREYSAPWKRGIIFHGPPGNGKTLTIKALANSLDKCEDTVATLIVRSFETCQGPQDGIYAVFHRAREMAPCLLVFEDLDSLLVDTVRSYFLNQVDGIDNNDGILIIASTNHLERLDPAVTKRPSRFDRKYHFSLPSEKERILYFEHWMKQLKTNDKIDFDPAICAIAANMTYGFSFAYLKELVMQALLAMARANVFDTTKGKNSGSNFTPADALDCVDGDLQTKSKMSSTPNTFDRSGKDTLYLPIPESLKDNLFMSTMRAGVAALRKDMHDAAGEETGT